MPWINCSRGFLCPQNELSVQGFPMFSDPSDPYICPSERQTLNTYAAFMWRARLFILKVNVRRNWKQSHVQMIGDFCPRGSVWEDHGAYSLWGWDISLGIFLNRLFAHNQAEAEKAVTQVFLRSHLHLILFRSNRWHQVTDVWMGSAHRVGNALRLPNIVSGNMLPRHGGRPVIEMRLAKHSGPILVSC